MIVYIVSKTYEACISTADAGCLDICLMQGLDTVFSEMLLTATLPICLLSSAVLKRANRSDTWQSKRNMRQRHRIRA